MAGRGSHVEPESGALAHGDARVASEAQQLLIQSLARAISLAAGAVHLQVADDRGDGVPGLMGQRLDGDATHAPEMTRKRMVWRRGESSAADREACDVCRRLLLRHETLVDVMHLGLKGFQCRLGLLAVLPLQRVILAPLCCGADDGRQSL